MTKFEQLRKAAKQVCESKGHNMVRYHIPYNGRSVKYAHSHCRDCKMEVTVNGCPDAAVERLRITGEASTTKCTGKSQS